MASRHPERVRRLILFLPTGLKESTKWSAASMVALVGLPGLNRFVYRNYLSRALHQGLVDQVCLERSFAYERRNGARLDHLRPATRRRACDFRLSGTTRLRYRVAAGSGAASGKRAGLNSLRAFLALPEKRFRGNYRGPGLCRCQNAGFSLPWRPGRAYLDHRSRARRQFSP